MYLLAEVFPWVKRLPIRFSRDQAVLFLTALMLVLVGVDIYFAHLLDSVIKPYEWIPIIFSPIAGIVMFLAGWISLKNRPAANLLASVVMAACLVVGGLGSYYHLRWTIQTTAPVGHQITTQMLMYGPPLLGPLTFILIALIGLSAIWIESPVDSGRLSLWGSRFVQMPTNKTQAYFIWVGLFVLATVISSVLDHSRTGFRNPWLWLPTVIGVFATIVSVGAGMLNRLNKVELWTYLISMLLMMAVGVVGFILHVESNLVRDGIVVMERFLRGAPFMAPLLFANMGLLGLLVLLEPKEK